MPCDLVYRDASGVETVLYDCSTTSTDLASCAALDAQVSWDATKLCFRCSRGRCDNIPMLLIIGVERKCR